MASPGNRHCVSCVGTLSFRIGVTRRGWVGSCAAVKWCWYSACRRPPATAGIFQTSVVARRPGFYAPAVESRRRSLSLSLYSVPAAGAVRRLRHHTVQPLALRQVVVAAPWPLTFALWCRHSLCLSDVSGVCAISVPVGIVADFHRAVVATSPWEKILVGRRPVFVKAGERITSCLYVLATNRRRDSGSVGSIAVDFSPWRRKLRLTHRGAALDGGGVCCPRVPCRRRDACAEKLSLVNWRRKPEGNTYRTKADLLWKLYAAVWLCKVTQCV